jgi:DNA-binding response OmpR family regulator
MEQAPLKSRVLVVEEDPSIHASLTERLSQEGFEFQTALTGQGARRRLAS